MDESREEMLRISIDSLRDWHRMKSNFTNAVFEQFNQGIRQNGLESQRASLLPHLQQYIDTALEKAKPNVRINGKKFEELNGDDDREVEPFDEALDRETWSLYNQRLQWDLDLATKRRNRPREVADLFEKLFKAREAATGDLDELPEEEDLSDPSLPDEAILAETEDRFSNVASLAEGLSQTLRTQLDRIRKLKDSEQEVNALKP